MGTKKNFLIIIVAIIMLCVIIKPNESEAALQSNGGTPATKNLSDWMLQIRQMQELGGTLGRKDAIDTTNLTSGATDLDIHMEKNTEYGAMVILSASSYGNPNKIEDGETTTGNSTGIVMNLNKEWVAAGTASMRAVNFKNAKNRYKNLYDLTDAESNAKSGDAVWETKGWHKSTISVWLMSAYGTISDAYASSALVRSYSNSIFSYYGNSSGNGWAEAGYYGKPWASRAAIVVGTGI